MNQVVPKIRRFCWSLLSSAVIVCCVNDPSFAAPAFPGAQGFGAQATGGRGGKVLKVINCNSSDPGSLAWAASQSGPRIIVFTVPCVIKGNVEIKTGNVTIAGQTAPGAGVTINGHLYTPYGKNTSNIIIRHLRVRPPNPSDDQGEWRDPEQHDALQFSAGDRIMLDHIDASHAADEIIDMWGGYQKVTLQWSTITFPLINSHPKGQHNYGFIGADGGSGSDRGGKISLLQNLFAHCKKRTPALGVGPAEVCNNIVYNAEQGFVHHNKVYNGSFNIVGNYYRDGPSAKLLPFWFDPENNPTPKYYLFNNWIDDPNIFTGRVDNPFKSSQFSNTYPGFYDTSVLLESHFNYSKANDFSAEKGYVAPVVLAPQVAYNKVLACAGAWPRDAVTIQAVNETKSRTGRWTNRTLSDLTTGLTPTPPKDSDNDGMPDAWESSKGLNPTLDDHNKVLAGGYTAIEVYINELADKILPVACGGITPSPTDGGGITPSPTDGGGITPSPTDGGGPSQIKTDGSAMDSNTTEGTNNRGNDDGCSCRITSSEREISWLPLLALLIIIFTCGRRD